MSINKITNVSDKVCSFPEEMRNHEAFRFAHSTEHLMIYDSENSAKFTARYPNKSNDIEAKLLVHDVKTYVDNLSTQMRVFGCDHHAWAFSINTTEYNNALICSPYATYIKYPLDMLEKFDKKSIRYLIKFGCRILGWIGKMGRINQVVQINNNLNSLIKHSEHLAHLLPYLKQVLLQQYPQHGILFFRVSETTDALLFNQLQQEGYLLFSDRLSHFFDPANNFIKRSQLKRDISLLKNTNYEIVNNDELNDTDIEKIYELYKLLFLKKHSSFNPAYTLTYFKEAIRFKWHHYRALRNPNGQIDGFISWFYRDGMMICGPLGYDIDIPQKTGLYRMLVAICLVEAHESQHIFNMGAGADQFKLKRGSQTTAEYTAIYCKHLPFYRRLPWLLLYYISRRIISKLLNMQVL